MRQKLISAREPLPQIKISNNIAEFSHRIPDYYYYYYYYFYRIFATLGNPKLRFWDLGDVVLLPSVYDPYKKRPPDARFSLNFEDLIISYRLNVTRYSYPGNRKF